MSIAGRGEKINLKDFIKSFEAPQRSVKIKFMLIFISLHFSEMHGVGGVKNGIMTFSSNKRFLNYESEIIFSEVIFSRGIL